MPDSPPTTPRGKTTMNTTMAMPVKSCVSPRAPNSSCAKEKINPRRIGKIRGFHPEYRALEADDEAVGASCIVAQSFQHHGVADHLAGGKRQHHESQRVGAHDERAQNRGVDDNDEKGDA